NLESLFHPRTVAVVGASDKPGKISGVIMESLAAAGFDGEVYPVNPSREEVGGVKCYPTLGHIEGGVDLAVLAVPAGVVPGVLEESPGAARGVVIIGGGFGEAGPEGKELERRVRDLARKSGTRVIGPNCMGLYNSSAGLDTFFIPREKVRRPPAGGVSIISQSGSFAITAMDELASEGVGVARVVSYGNKLDVNEADCLAYLAEDESTTAVAVYMESVTDGHAFVEAASRCAAVKPVMALKVGRFGAGASAARSHTGALTGRYEVYRAAFRKAGVIEVGGYEEFIGGCKALGAEKTPRGRRVAIVTDGGGIGVGLADSCSEAGLEVPPLDEYVKEELAGEFPSYFGVSNPLDLTGSVTDGLFAEAVEKVLDGDNFDMAIVAALWG
ncbi:MAG TPA: CoA-binding protein, partial [Gammaproteobacteria bacterium]|nr:CoA-binding protein [Gammaproteobacteria bacterium]